jgi:ankyrin repeat protein
MVRLLLEKGVNPNVRSLAGELPMDVAVRNGFVEITKLLAGYRK